MAPPPRPPPGRSWSESLETRLGPSPTCPSGRPLVVLVRGAEPCPPARRAAALPQLDVDRAGEAARVGRHQAGAFLLEDDAGLAPTPATSSRGCTRDGCTDLF